MSSIFHDSNQLIVTLILSDVLPLKKRRYDVHLAHSYS